MAERLPRNKTGRRGRRKKWVKGGEKEGEEMGEEEGEEAREGGGVTTSDPIFIAMRHVQSFRNTSVSF